MQGARVCGVEEVEEAGLLPEEGRLHHGALPRLHGQTQDGCQIMTTYRQTRTSVATEVL